jgi:S-DNA-T family DNA segregation ATPase FtsK/SpoIIIE
MKPSIPYRPAYTEKSRITMVDEFNIWCALNDKPFNLIQHVWPDGMVEWDLEIHPGTPKAEIIYGTGQDNGTMAVISAFAFLAGVEWAEERQATARIDDDDEGQAAPTAILGQAAPAAAPGQAAPAVILLPAPVSPPAPAAPTAPTPDDDAGEGGDEDEADGDDAAEDTPAPPVEPAAPAATAPAVSSGARVPPLDLLQAPPPRPPQTLDEGLLARNARNLETVLRNFRIRGEIMEVRPGPVVTLYELEPAPGTKSSTVINLTDDIARSMSAMTCRIAIVPGRSVIGVELPNPVREMVYLREMLDSDAFQNTSARLAVVLGKDIGGEPVIADLARMPHLLIAGTTGSGKSVGINTMILSLLYRLTADRCRFIMVDPKMLELSVYDGIPHLLTPVVTDPKKAVVALRWAVREMEQRYEAMARLAVRNIEGYNHRIKELQASGEKITRRVSTGYDRTTRQPLFEDQAVEPALLPYIVIVVDEMADLMLVAGKDIEAVIQRLAQMARAAGIHLIMATQRPSVDVITGTIKANFPTRISFQVTSKIDSRTILGEAGAEQLLGQGDMLYMAGGGRITRVHGPFVSDSEVEDVVQFVRSQGTPNYIHAITEDEEEEDGPEAAGAEDGPVPGSSGDDLYDQAIALVAREQKVSVSFIQRYLQVGYNRAARIVERMESERVISTANHVGKREVLVSGNRRFD